MKKRSKVWIAMLLTIALVMSMGLTACSGTSDNPGTDTQSPETQAPASEEPSQTPTEAPNEPAEDDCPFELFAYDLPSGIKKPNEQGGTVTEEHYITHRYDVDGTAGEEVEATLYVYTPYGYDSSKEYNIIYLMHGAGETVGFWFGAGDYEEGGERYNKAQGKAAVNIIDNMTANGDCDGTILVAATFLNQFDDSEGVMAAGSTEKLPKFAYEFKNDIVPCVEAKYSTYAGGDVSEENLIASRDHRAYAGFSMGSMTGFQAIWMNCVEYVSYIGNFSGCDAQGTGIAEKVAEALNTKYADYDIKYWYNGNGTEDSLHDDHVAGYATILEKCVEKFTEGEDYANGQNTIFVDKPGKQHNYANWNVDLYNILHVFFKVP